MNKLAVWNENVWQYETILFRSWNGFIIKRNICIIRQSVSVLGFEQLLKRFLIACCNINRFFNGIQTQVHIPGHFENQLRLVSKKGNMTHIIWFISLKTVPCLSRLSDFLVLNACHTIEIKDLSEKTVHISLSKFKTIKKFQSPRDQNHLLDLNSFLGSWTPSFFPRWSNCEF